MNGRQRNATNAQIWGKKNDSNYVGNCTSRDLQFGTYKILDRWIFVRLSVSRNAQSPERSLCTYIFLFVYSYVEAQHQKKILPKEYVSNVMQITTLAACING